MASVSPVLQETLTLGRYVLAPVRHVRIDPLHNILGPQPGVYICNCPEPTWYAHHHWPQGSNVSINKKRRMFAHMAPASHWLSMTTDNAVRGPTHTWQAPSGILHLGRGMWRGRAAQLWQVAQLAGWLVRERARYETCLVYNFDQPQYLAALMAKVVLGKRLVVDYEDDYTTYRKSRLKNWLEQRMRGTVDAAICVNAHMLRHFPHKPAAVVECFADLSYVPAVCPLREGMTFVYSGRLDDIRGADLLPDLVKALRTRLKSFKVHVTGKGPLQRHIERLKLPELRYLGFVPDTKLREILQAADACLILQRPDHPFSLGSYPSKLETYAEQRKVVYGLRLRT